jgi:peptide/nickel transport system substrate-binding protein
MVLIGSARADNVLRIAPVADLKILDPHVTTTTITLMHGQLVYDTLFAWDRELNSRPQMVESYSASGDKLLYTFTLRPGLKFHDGQPVTTRDVIPSVKRWMVRDVLGQKLGEAVADMQAVDDRTFTIRLKTPFPFVEMALGASSGNTPVIMREKDAATDPFQNVSSAIGSGPFRFVRSEWVPGAKIVYERNPDYVPRAEPPNGLAGGKVVKVDRVEFIVLPDAVTKAAALQAGEIDILDQVPHDIAAPLERNPDITVADLSPLGRYGLIRPNHLYPPFNDVRARQALALLVDQREYASAAIGEPKWWSVCYSFFVCGSPNGTEVGSDAVRQKNVERAKQLLKEAGYKGEPLVIINSHEIPSIGALGDVTTANLRAAGINVDLREVDWGTMVTLRAIKEPPTQRGWHIFHTTVIGAGMYSPLTNYTVDSSCGGKSWFGWPCDERAEALGKAYIAAPDEASRRQALEALHARLWETLPIVLTGQFQQPYAWRKNVVGLVQSHLIAFWNVEKK